MKNNLRKHVVDTSGSGLVMAMMTLFVLSILGTALMGLAISNARLTQVDGQGDATYYVAESGLNRATNEMEYVVRSMYENDPSVSVESYFTSLEEHIENGPTHLNGYTYDEFEENYGASPEADISIEQIEGSGNTRSYRLVSEGRIDNITRRLARDVTVNFPETDDSGEDDLPIPTPPGSGGSGSPYAALVRNNINALGGTINGDVYSDSTDSHSINLDWGSKINGNIYLPTGANPDEVVTAPQWYEDVPEIGFSDVTVPWEYYYEIVDNFPSAPSAEYPGDLTLTDRHGVSHDIFGNGSFYYNSAVAVNEEFVLDMTESMRFDEFVVSNQGRLTIETNGQSHNLVVNSLDIFGNGGLDISGGGEVNLFVLDNLNLASNISIGNPSNSSNLNVYYSGTDSFGGYMQPWGNPEYQTFTIYGSLFNLNADIYIGSSSGVTGFMVTAGDIVHFGGGTTNNTFLLAPYADVTISGGGTINGLLISETLEISGGINLNYVNQNEIPVFPFTPSENSTAPNLETLADLFEVSTVYDPDATND